MLPFHPESDLLESRARVRRAVDRVLEQLQTGRLPDEIERQLVDLKEEAGRRGSGGVLLPGSERNTAAAAHLADEVACFANSPNGGALVVGVENATGQLLGTALDTDWLRHAIYSRVDLAPLVEEREVQGVRLLVLYIAPTREPVEDTGRRIRWRVGSHCVPVDRTEWWVHRQDRVGYDPMAAATDRTVVDVSPGALVVARRYLGQNPDRDRSDAPELLRRLGILRSDGRLSQAGALLMCPSDRTHVSLSVLEVESGDVLLRPADLAGLSVLEQLAAVEARLETINTEVTVRSGFVDTPVRRLPPAAVREAVLNALIHRDWLLHDPVAVTWVQADSALQVISPGGFGGGVTEDTVLTQRWARHPALADLFRALDLVDKQGLGVDRMYREMVALGHRPPVIVEEPGPQVRVRLSGGQPVVPVMALTTRIDPAVRRSDVRVMLIVDHLIRHPFLDVATTARVLQRTPPEAAEALATANDCRVEGVPLIRAHKDVWLLADVALRVVEDASRRRRDTTLLPYRRPEDPARILRPWFEGHDRVSSTDYAVLTGLTSAGALAHLDRSVSAGLLVRGDGRGRNAHFRRGPAL